MGEIIFDSFISLPLFDGPERRQSSQDRHPRQARRAIPPASSHAVWQATAPPHRRYTQCCPLHLPPLSAHCTGATYMQVKNLSIHSFEETVCPQKGDKEMRLLRLGNLWNNLNHKSFVIFFFHIVSIYSVQSAATY